MTPSPREVVGRPTILEVRVYRGHHLSILLDGGGLVIMTKCVFAVPVRSPRPSI